MCLVDRGLQKAILFGFFYKNELIQNITQQTNLFSNHTISKKKIHLTILPGQIETAVAKMKAFTGVVLNMGIYKKSKKEKTLKTPREMLLLWRSSYEFRGFHRPPLFVQKPFPSICPTKLPAEKEPVDRIIGSAFEPESYALHAIALPISCSDSRQILSSKLQSNWSSFAHSFRAIKRRVVISTAIPPVPVNPSPRFRPSYMNHDGIVTKGWNVITGAIRGRKNRISSGMVPRPVISAVRRERPEDRLSLLEPIFHEKTLAKSLERPCRDLSRARAPPPITYNTYMATLYIHAGIARDTHGGLVAWWRSRWKNGRFHMNAFHANASSAMGNGRLEEASRDQEQSAEPSTQVPSTEYRVPSIEHRAPSTQV
ncbi:hypothetical protein K0M31_010010 [Melipona bicolor]|uniref:Uncharacterized protein n=1 Tax=Melipona bicolor TaxID=60889 RepID=A0AA40FM88_9HYME|nr:hypothetical protein K0M31_010010 [Melipona bicolor]